MDYGGQACWVRHMDFASFETQRLAERRRLVLLSTAGEHFYHRTVFEPDDILMLGSESAGVPAAVHACADLRRCSLQEAWRAYRRAWHGAIVKQAVRDALADESRHRLANTWELLPA